MKRVIWIFSVILIAVIGVSFYFNIFGTKDLFTKLDNVITGSPILADDGFVREAKDFGTGSNLVFFKDRAFFSPDSSSSSDTSSSSGSESDSDSGCVIQSVSWSEKFIVAGNSVQIVVYGEECDGQSFDVGVFEKDTFFDDDVIVLEGSFVNGRALIDWTISDDLTYLFDGVFEGDELEVYFKIDFNDVELVSSLLVVSDEEEGVLLEPFIGEGCNNYQYIDKDCDGFVIGGKNAYVGIMYDLIFPPILELGADANDNDASLNTSASVIARYGDFTNINNFKTYLYDLGYTHTINNVYFVALNGNDLTAQ
ncbi:MAG: hypothetical protein AABX94_04955, partial [Nanoarchaeota archaeon]